LSNPDVHVVVTGTAWMGGGVGSIESAMERLFREGRQEILLTAYAISSSVDMLLDWLESALTRGVQVEMVTNRLEDQPPDVQGRLRQLAVTYPHFHLYSFSPVDAAEPVDLHAKVIVADRRMALIGSSNLSRRGLLTNHEFAVLVGGAAASTAAGVLDRLLASRYVTRVPG
jgi:cardiolipin synthase